MNNLSFDEAIKKANQEMPEGHSVDLRHMHHQMCDDQHVLIFHELKDGIPLIYWFLTYENDSGFIRFDIRVLLDSTGVKLPSNWFDRCRKIESVWRLVARCYKKFDGSFADMIRLAGEISI